jgi:hypothetical protein
MNFDLRSTPARISRGIDWLTLISLPGSDEELIDYARGVRDSENLRDLYDEKKWKWLGYKGWSVGPLRYGLGKEGSAVVQFSSDLASTVDVVGLLAFARPTRVDVQYTFFLEKPYPDLARVVYESMVVENDNLARAVHYTHISSNTGQTLYVNRRTAPVFLRLYDKSADSETDSLGQIWRLEVEYKSKAAPIALEEIAASQDQKLTCGALAIGEFRKRGIEFVNLGQAESFTVEVGKRKSTNETRLAWLSRSVRPVIAKLVENDLELEALVALGFGWLVDYHFGRYGRKSS